MNLKQSLIIALVLSIAALGAWELYWRSKGYFPNLDDDKYLWAKTRAKVEKATENDVVLVGSSRVLFDIQLDVWEKMTGIRPIQLANPGASPLPVFHDLVENTDFKGTAIVGVTPPLFFSTTFPQAPPGPGLFPRFSSMKTKPMRRNSITVCLFHFRTHLHL